MLKIGIVGLPNVGKSTLFNALTKQAVPAENYPFCTIDPSVGIVGVPDERVAALAKFSGSEKVIPAAIEFVDIAGLVKGASKGEGLGNQFLTHIREVDAILEVVRFFDDADVLHVHGDVEPVRDMEIINLELVLADSQVVVARLDRLTRDVKAGMKEAVAEAVVLKKLEQALSCGTFANHAGLTLEELKLVKTLNLLTLKPVLYAFNGKSGGHNLDELNDGRAERAFAYVKEQKAGYVLVDAATERELNDVADDDREGFRRELGVPVDGLGELIRKSYDTVGLISYFTTGPKETRAWTVSKGSTAPVAGAAIHTDFLDKFIRAEVIAAKDLLLAGSYAAAREKGLVRTEGKEYVVQDGDVMVFLHG
ncbi:MAG: redox-regulated ATPase YchF [bacterium]